MLDVKFVRENIDGVEQALKNRGSALSLDTFSKLDVERRDQLAKVEVLKARRNTVSQEVAKMKKAGENADSIIEEMRLVGDEMSA